MRTVKNVASMNRRGRLMGSSTPADPSVLPKRSVQSDVPATKRQSAIVEQLAAAQRVLSPDGTKHRLDMAFRRDMALAVERAEEASRRGCPGQADGFRRDCGIVFYVDALAQLALTQSALVAAKVQQPIERTAKLLEPLPVKGSSTKGSPAEPRRLAESKPSAPAEPLQLHADRLYTTAEAAQILGVSPKTLESWRYSGKVVLPYIRPAGAKSVRYKGSDLIAFIEANRRSSTSS